MQKSNQFVKTLNQLDKQLQRAKTYLADVRFFYGMGHREYACDKALDMEEVVEKSALLARALPAYTGSPNASERVGEVIGNTIPVSIGFTEQGWFSIRLPLLLPKKASGNVEYIRGFLYSAMRNFFKGKSPVKYRDCVVVFRHVYDRQRPERQYRDHDNFEINFVTDTIALYVLPDDSPATCSHYYCSAASSVERTEVYIVPKADFKQWLLLESSMPDKGVLLYETKP